MLADAGYAAYRFYGAHQRQLVRVEQQAADELVKNQLQAHFENVQRISDMTTLPFAMHYLRSRVMEELDISHLTEKLLQGKGESGLLTTKEKLDTWDRIKILSFTRTVSSMWAMTLLSLYVRVQVTILGRHLYLDFARGTRMVHSYRLNLALLTETDTRTFLQLLTTLQLMVSLR